MENNSTSNERTRPDDGDSSSNSGKTKSGGHENSIYQISPTKPDEPEVTITETLASPSTPDDDNVRKSPTERRTDSSVKSRTPRNNQSKLTPVIDGNDGASGVKTRSQTKKKTVSLSEQVNLDEEFKKLSLESTPKISDASGIKSTPMRPNSAKTRSHRRPAQSWLIF